MVLGRHDDPGSASSHMPGSSRPSIKWHSPEAVLCWTSAASVAPTIAVTAFHASGTAHSLLMLKTTRRSLCSFTPAGPCPTADAIHLALHPRGPALAWLRA